MISMGHIRDLFAVALRGVGALAIIIALQVPHAMVAMADDPSGSGLIAQSQLHAFMDHGQDGAKSSHLPPSHLPICAQVCVGGLVAWAVPFSAPEIVVHRIAWLGSADLRLALSVPDPALRPPRPSPLA
jgi:hypothetical protein